MVTVMPMAARSERMSSSSAASSASPFCDARRGRSRQQSTIREQRCRCWRVRGQRARRLPRARVGRQRRTAASSGGCGARAVTCTMNLAVSAWQSADAWACEPTKRQVADSADSASAAERMVAGDAVAECVRECRRRCCRCVQKARRLMRVGCGQTISEPSDALSRFRTSHRKSLLRFVVGVGRCLSLLWSAEDARWHHPATLVFLKGAASSGKLGEQPSAPLALKPAHGAG